MVVAEKLTVRQFTEASEIGHRFWISEMIGEVSIISVDNILHKGSFVKN